MAVVLIVDDELTLAHSMARALTAFGEHTVYEAPDGRAALSIIQRETVDLVIADVMMPRMGGPELMRAVQACGRTMPFLFISSLPDRIVRGLIGGACDYLTKPFSIDELRGAVEECLSEWHNHRNVARDSTRAPAPRRGEG